MKRVTSYLFIKFLFQTIMTFWNISFEIFSSDKLNNLFYERPILVNIK